MVQNAFFAVKQGRSFWNFIQIKKTFKKGVDKIREAWYNSQAVAERDGKRSLKIEQQEIKYKASQDGKVYGISLILTWEEKYSKKQ